MTEGARRDRLAAPGGEPETPGARCLSGEQLLALQSAAPGRMPAEVAAHLASCERCQRRALFGAEPAQARRTREVPSLRTAFLRVAIVLVALAMVLVSIAILVG